MIFSTRRYTLRIVPGQIWRMPEGRLLVASVGEPHGESGRCVYGRWLGRGGGACVNLGRLAKHGILEVDAPDPRREGLVANAARKLAQTSGDGVAPRRRNVLHGPRGIMRVTQQQREAVAAVEAGADRREVAAKYGVAPATIVSWMHKVHEADYDERRMRA